MSFDVELVRSQFPALALTDEGRRRVYLDNPAGTQVPQQVVDRMVSCMTRSNSNLGGFFPTTIQAGEIVEQSHVAMADFVNADSADEIVFGQNMTTLTFHISRSIGRMTKPGDEIVVTRMDHDGNIAPWLALAEDHDLVIRWFDFDPDSFEFDVDAFDDVLSDRTRLVALTYASNLTGTRNDVKTLIAKAKAAGALTYIDAVQFAPHGLIDVQDLGCDFLVCSPYKFYGPHQGVLWGRLDLMEQLIPYKVRPASAHSPGKFETGTLSHEGMAGTLGAVEYIAWLGETAGSPAIAVDQSANRRRQAVAAGMAAMTRHENGLTARLIGGLSDIPGLKVQGITNLNRLEHRVPTVSVTVDGHRPVDIAKSLAAQNIFVWNGHNYALEVVRKLGLESSGGVVRIGMAHYNTEQEIDEAIEAVRAATR